MSRAKDLEELGCNLLVETFKALLEGVKSNPSPNMLAKAIEACQKNGITFGRVKDRETPAEQLAKVLPFTSKDESATA